MRGALLIVAVAGCKGKGDGLVMEQKNNYTYSNTIDIQSVEVGSGADANVDWSGLATDVRARTVDPTQVQQISLVKFSYSLDELLPLVAQNKIDAQKQADEIYLFDNCLSDGDPCTTSNTLGAFQITGIAFDPATLLLEDDSVTWLVSVLDKPRGSIDLLMSKAITPKDASNNHDVTVGDGDTTLDYTVDLHSAPSIQAPAGSPDVSLDWSAVKKDVYGNDYNSVAGDTLLIGHYSGQTVDDVEAEFLQLDTAATEVYRTSVVQATSLDDLSIATDEAGNAFPGFDTDGTWLVGVQCSTCSTPVPLLLATVSVQ